MYIQCRIYNFSHRYLADATAKLNLPISNLPLSYTVTREWVLIRMYTEDTIYDYNYS